MPPTPRSLQQFLEGSAERTPERCAITCGSERLTFRELRERAAAIAKGLVARGVGRGDVVVVWMNKSVDVVAVYYAILAVGAAYAPINGDTPARYVNAVIERAQPALVVVRSRAGMPEELIGAPIAEAASLAVDAPTAPGGWESAPQSSGEDLAYVHFTSGSTGQPKGVAITHRAALTYMDVCAGILRGGADDVVCNHAPLAFDLASFDVHLAMRWGATLHMLRSDEIVAPGSLIRHLQDARPTVLYTVPTTLNRLAALSSIGSLVVTSMRALIFAGEPPNPVALRKLRAVFPNAVFHHWYGSTEAALLTQISFAPGVELPDPLPIGEAVDGVQLAVRSEDGTIEPVRAGRSGELLASSDLVFEGYLRDAAATEAAFLEPAWFRTRDAVRCDEHGRLFFVTRTDRMVKVRGMRVDPEEVATAVRRHPYVRDCAVVALPDARNGGARLVAFVVGPAASTSSLREDLKRDMPSYLVPEVIAAGDVLPTTASGKVDARALLARIADA